VFNFALTQVLRDPLFVTTGRIDGKPTGRSGYFRANPKSRSGSQLDIFEIASSQGFAILTWVKYSKKGFKPRVQRNSWGILMGRMEALAFIQFAMLTDVFIATVPSIYQQFRKYRVKTAGTLKYLFDFVKRLCKRLQTF
jgi:hypothetical protein